MNILMLSDVYFPRVNGVSTSIRTFARELRRLGHSVTVVAPRYGDDDSGDDGDEDDIEVRRVHITNRSRAPRAIDVTSYAELVLAPAAADATLRITSRSSARSASPSAKSTI